MFFIESLSKMLCGKSVCSHLRIQTYTCTAGTWVNCENCSLRVMKELVLFITAEESLECNVIAFWEHNWGLSTKTDRWTKGTYGRLLDRYGTTIKFKLVIRQPF